MERGYDSRLGRWLSIDPKAQDYASWSPYVFTMNTPINAYDPDGKRTYFVAGAGLDTKGWNYTDRWAAALKKNGIKDFKALRDLSHDKPGSFPAGDISFTSSYRNSSTELVPTSTTFKGEASGWAFRRINDKMIEKAVNDLAKNPLKEGEQLNLTGYSYGSVLQAHVALRLVDKGYKIDNVVLVGSPISSDSDLYKELTKNKNIGKVIREDIPGDKLSDPKNGVEYLEGAVQNNDDSGPHFDLARPGKEADEKIDNTVKDIKSKGVE